MRKRGVQRSQLCLPPRAEGCFSLAFAAGFRPQEILLHPRTGLHPKAGAVALGVVGTDRSVSEMHTAAF